MSPAGGSGRWFWLPCTGLPDGDAGALEPPVDVQQVGDGRRRAWLDAHQAGQPGIGRVGGGEPFTADQVEQRRVRLCEQLVQLCVDGSLVGLVSGAGVDALAPAQQVSGEQTVCGTG